MIVIICFNLRSEIFLAGKAFGIRDLIEYEGKISVSGRCSFGRR
jgi:hypothetical protein